MESDDLVILLSPLTPVCRSLSNSGNRFRVWDHRGAGVLRQGGVTAYAEVGKEEEIGVGGSRS